MELYFYSNGGSWYVDIDTTQGDMPAMLSDMVRDAIEEAINKFERKCNAD